MEPVVLVLKLVDGDKKPTMGYIYQALEIMYEKVEEAAGRSKEPFLKIIRERRLSMLSHPLHLTGKYVSL
jgi:hypothetical protein